MQRQIENYNQVDQVVPDLTQAQAGQDIAAVGQYLGEKAQKAKINQNMSQAQLAINALNNDYQTQNQGNPTGNLKEYEGKRKEILTKFGEEISPMYRGDWQDATQKVVDSSDINMQGWTFKQLRQNAANSINDSMRNNFTQANTDGMNYAAGNLSVVDAFANFDAASSQLQKYGNEHIGESDMHDTMQTYRKDYLKSFVSGVAETAPQQAMGLLDDDNIKGEFTPDERKEMVGVIASTQKRQKLAAAFNVTNNESSVVDLVNDQKQTYFQKRLDIDRMELSGQISKEYAAKARRVLTSEKNVNSVTSTPVMAEIVNQMYDLNAAQATPQDYLRGVNQVRTSILDKQANGELTAQDVQTLNNRLSSLTSSKTAEATQMAGLGFHGANKVFESLPLQYRGDATRQLFYATDGKKNLSDDQYKTLATGIADKINTQRRAQTLDSVKSVTISDDDLLKSAGYSIDDVNETARVHNMTPEQVIQKLRAKRQK